MEKSFAVYRRNDCSHETLQWGTPGTTLTSVLIQLSTKTYKCQALSNNRTGGLDKNLCIPEAVLQLESDNSSPPKLSLLLKAERTPAAII